MRKLTHSEILEKRLTLEESGLLPRFPVSIIADNIRSLYNVGSLFRTCDSARVSELILCGFTPHPPRKEIEKTALGAVDTVPWQYEKRTIDAITSQKEKGQKIIALEITDSTRMFNALTIADFPMSLVIGNELTGLDNDVLAACDDSVEIPMFGLKHSLNVSVAAGIAIYQAVVFYNNLFPDLIKAKICP
jgi:23S rRNA (guanosine2251-2'-O)-methyltransferase